MIASTMREKVEGIIGTLDSGEIACPRISAAVRLLNACRESSVAAAAEMGTVHRPCDGN
jgi:hypothetical protein